MKATPHPRVAADAGEGLGWQAALVAQASAGDEASFEALVRLHQDRAYQVALRMTGVPQDAQDVVQDALLQAWRALPNFRGEASFGTWLIRMVINRCHNLRRDTRPSSALPDDELLVSATPGPDATVVASSRRDATLAAIADLPFDQRAAVVLHTFGGCTHAEVGRILGVTEATAKVRVHRARRALLERLKDWR